MQERRTWIRWIGAIATPLVIAGCGTVVLEPITDDSGGHLTTVDIDPDKQIKDFTPAEAEAWCTAYSTSMMLVASGVPGTSACAENLGIVDGYVSNSCYSRLCDYGGSEPWLCVVIPTVELCIQNLTLHACEATRSELDTCVASIRDLDAPGTQCADGCGPFRSHPSCAETVVHKFDYWEEGGSRCRLAVE